MNFDVNQQNVSTGSALGVLILVLPAILLLNTLLALWGAWWIQDIWVHHLTSLLGDAPSVLTLAIFGIAGRAMFPSSVKSEEGNHQDLLTLFVAPPIAWVFAQLVAWVG